MDSTKLAEGVTCDDGTCLGDFLHNYAKKLANSTSDGKESQMESINYPHKFGKPNSLRRAAVNDDVADSLHDYAKKDSNIIAGRREGNFLSDNSKSGVDETSRATEKIHPNVTQHDYAKKFINDIKSSLDSELLAETRKETHHEFNKLKNYAGDVDFGHNYAKKIINSHDNLENTPNILKETRKESNESIENYTSGCVSVHDYAKKLANNESICDCNKLENETNEPSQSVTNKDDSRASLHDYAKKIDVLENLLSISIFNLDIGLTKEMKNYYRISKPGTSNSESCDEVHNYAKKATNGLEGIENNAIGLDCQENTSKLDGRRSLIHNYAKKLDDDFEGCSSNLLVETEEIGKEFYENFKEVRKSVIKDKNCQFASVHDYAKPIEKEIVGLRANSDLLMSGRTDGDLCNESTKLCKSKANDDRICGAVFVHDYAKKITHVSVDHDIMLKSISDKERPVRVINEADREPNKFSRQSASVNEVFGQESVHDYAKKTINLTNEHESNLLVETEEIGKEFYENFEEVCKPVTKNRNSQFERLPNDVEILQGKIIVDESNVSCELVKNEVDRESNKCVKPIADDYVISSGTCVHDYAKKAVNRNRDCEKMSEASYYIGKRKSDEELDKPCKLMAYNAVCSAPSTYDNEKMHIGHGRTLESDCDNKVGQNKIDAENNESYKPCKPVEDEIHEKSLELDERVPNNDKNFIVNRNSIPICGIKILEIKINEVAKESDVTSKSVEANQESGELAPNNNAVYLGSCEKQITDVVANQEVMSLCDNGTLELDSNKKFDKLDKISANCDGVCEGLVEGYEEEITNVVHDGFPDNECDVEILELERNEESFEPSKTITSEVVRKSDEIEKSLPNVEQQNEDNGDSGWQSVRTVVCLFCDDLFESVSVLYRHVSKYHWELKERLKIEDSEVRCKQCDEMVNYSKMYDHKMSHLLAENKCHYCNLVFHSSKRLENHVSTHILTEHFCSYCGMQFTNNRNKMIHITRVHKEKKNNPCEACGLQFQSLPQLKIHLKKIHHKTSEHFCSYCGKEFSNAANKMNHMKVHTMSDPRQFLCEVCGGLFVDQRSLECHQRLHENRGDYVCKSCTRSFQTQTELDVHTSTHLKAFSCTVCSKRFHKKYLVRQHMLSHSKMKPYSCFCGVTFNRVGNFKRHTNKHKTSPSTNNEQTLGYVCSICKRDLKTETRLRWHEAKHAGEKKPFDCDVCGSRFAKLNYYKVHMMKHTGERPFTCTVCQQGFRTQHTLQQHTAHVHMDIYSFKCDVCGQPFKQRNALDNHKVTHTGKQAFS